MKSVLVIDNSGLIYHSINKIINEEPELKSEYSVYYSLNCFDGLIEIVKLNPSLIFLDYENPDLNAFEMTTLIKSNNNFSDIPIIVISEKDNIFDKTQSKLLGVNEYLNKKMTKDEITFVLKKYL